MSAKNSLYELRKSLSLHQDEVAERAEMVQSAVSRVERRGDKRVSTLQRYAKALGGRLRIYIEVKGHSYEVRL